jgi:tryptophan synthase beta subunit
MTLHDQHTICNKEGMLLSLTLAQAINELEKARENGDEKGIMILNLAIDMILDQIEPIEE